MIANKLFTEIFRPKSFDKMVLLPRIRKELEKGLCQNLLLVSSTPGSGKTTAARILCDGYDTLKLNGSISGIDVVKNEIITFSTTVSIMDGGEKLKVVYIDECDALTAAAWDALRETIEHYASNVRFIMTCNKLDRIPNYIQSRFNVIPFYPLNKEEEDTLFGWYCSYVGQILSATGISYEDDVLAEFVRNSFPDMRTILNSIQSMYLQEEKHLSRDSIMRTFDCSDLFNMIVNGTDPVENYKFVMENYSTTPDDAMLAISKEFVDFIRTSYPDHAKSIPLAIICIAEYMSQLPTAPDRVLVLLATCFKLQVILHS